MERVSKNTVMFLTILICLFSCSAHKSIVPELPYSVHQPVVVSDTQNKDTPLAVVKNKVSFNNDSLAKDIAPKISLLSEQVIPKRNDIDYQKLNAQWQRLTIRLLDSAMARKREKDSVLSELRTFRAETAQNFKGSMATSKMYGNIGGVCIVIIALCYVAKFLIFLFSKKPLSV